MARRFWPAEASPPTMDLLILAAVCILVAASVEAPAIDHLSAELRRLGDGDYLAALRSHPHRSSPMRPPSWRRLKRALAFRCCETFAFG